MADRLYGKTTADADRLLAQPMSNAAGERDKLSSAVPSISR
jgi:hypothetical protein